MFAKAKKIFYFQQYFVIRLGEKVYEYDSKKESFPFLRAFLSLCYHAIKASKLPVSNIDFNQFKYLVYLETLNQKNAIIDIFQEADKKEFLFVVNNNIEVSGFENYQFRNKTAFLKAIFRLPEAYSLSVKYRKKQKGIVNEAHILVNFALFLASAELFETDLRTGNFEKIIVTNDHNLQPLALLYAAKKTGIKSYYIQHASVSEAFPKLLPDVALLEGNQAVDTYKKLGNLSRKTELVGIARMDGLLSFKKSVNKTDRVVGLCLKPYYSKELIQDLIGKIKASNSVSKIILRPHPGNSKPFYDFLERFGVEISNAKVQRPHDFIKQLDVMISGESSIILEAALMNVKTLYIDDQVAQFDLYGFVRHGVTESLSSLDDLTEVLSRPNLTDNIQDYYKNCQYYCSTVNTPYQNKSKDLILHHLLDT